MNYQKEISVTIIFTIVTKRTKYPETNFAKKVKDLYSEHYQTLMKEIEDNINEWKDIRINTIKMSILSKAIYRFSAIPIRVSMAFFTESGQIILKCVLEPRKSLNSQAILRKKKKKQSWRNQTP